MATKFIYMHLCLLGLLAVGKPAFGINYGLGQGLLGHDSIGVDTCVTGDVVVVNSAFQEVQTNFAGDQSYNLNQFKGKAALGLNTGLLGVGGEIDVLSSVEDNAKSITVLMTYRTIAKEVMLTNVKAIPGKNQAMCGDAFVKSRQLGGRLYIAYTFYFNSDAQRRDFTKQMTVSLFFGLFKKTYNKTSNNDKNTGDVKVQLKAWQFGGDPRALARILAPMQPSVCTFDAPGKCTDNLKILTSYAQNDFVSQLNGAINQKQWDQLDAQNVALSDYTGLGIVSQAPDQNTVDQMVAKRQQLIVQMQEIKASLGLMANGQSSTPARGDLDAIEQKLLQCSIYASAQLCLN